MNATATTTVLAPFGALRDAWTVDTDCADCLHLAYATAVDAQRTGKTVFAVRHDDHSAQATLAAEATTLTPFGALTAAWVANTSCADCLHAAYVAAVEAQGTGEITVTVSHDDHTATASLAF